MPDEDPSKRSIRSFVRRGGRLTPSQRHAIEAYWPEYGIEFQQGMLALPGGFAAFKLEIGIGNGDALIHMASGDRDSLYLGIEVHEPGIGRCLNNIDKLQLNNLRLIKHDAIEVLEQMIGANLLDRILLFFPDPWHKKRHHKRRIVNRRFRDLAHRVLKPGAAIHIATDWQDYAESIAGQFLDDDRFVNMGNAAGHIERPDYRPLTRFEQRGLRLGHGVWDLLFSKAIDKPVR
ncbi:MAG: tRNA (guanosine(46)-N7)-methyltransferase TrmB [Gammaproteobacteria bacterium]|jgi:tRNA (guanine-N7-)-methyltransferase|nr:tRNA (guanosine(46)-N7)-methyltransferase TrmB [Gammaproteobacteria bacterium]